MEFTEAALVLPLEQLPLTLLILQATWGHEQMTSMLEVVRLRPITTVSVQQPIK